MNVRLQGETAQVRRWYGWESAREWHDAGFYGATIVLKDGRDVYIGGRALARFHAGGAVPGEVSTRLYRFPTVEAMFGLWCAIIGTVIAGLAGWPLPIGVIGSCVGMYVLFFITVGVEMHILRHMLLLLIIIGATFAVGGMLGGVEGAKAAVVVAAASLVVFLLLLAILVANAFFWDWVFKPR